MTELRMEDSSLDSQNSNLWDKVAEKYSEVPDFSEIELADEIFQILMRLGLSCTDTLLEVGCGSGHLSRNLAEKGFQTTLMDFSSVALGKAKKNFELNNLKGSFIRLNLFDISPEIVGFHSVVWNSGVLEHYSAWQAIEIFKKMATVAKKYVIVIVPNARSEIYLQYRQILMKKNKWLYGRELLRDSIRHIAEAAGLEVIDEIYIGKQFTQNFLNEINFEHGKEQASINDIRSLPDDQNYLIALIARPKNPCINANYEIILENLIEIESSVEKRTYDFDLASEKERLKNSDKCDDNRVKELKREIDIKDHQISYLENLIHQRKTSLSWQLCQIYGNFFQDNSNFTKIIRWLFASFFLKIIKNRKKTPHDYYEKYKNDLDNILSENKEKVKGIILYPPTVDWNVPLFQRPQQLALELSKKGYLFFYCTNNIFDKVSGFSHIINQLILTDQYSLLLKELHEYIFLLHAGHPSITITDIIKIKETNHDIFIIYEYIDEISEKILGEINLEMLKRHEYMVRNADCVIVTADNLFNKIKNQRDHGVYLIPNAVDYPHFHIKRDISLIPNDLQSIIEKRNPIIGYFGALASWFDYELVKYLAINRSEYQIVLIGWNYDNSLDISGINKIENIHYLGVKEYYILPKYAVWFDVSIIPFVLNEITKSTSPIKIFEYMALGTPIVTTDLDECKKYKSVLIGRDYQEFVEKVDEAITLRGDNQYLSLLDQEARENTWEKRADAINQLIVKNHSTILFHECQKKIGQFTKNLYYLTDYQKAEENYYKCILKWINEDSEIHHIERILDIGCGYGTLLLFAKKKYNCICYAIDNSDAYISQDLINKYNIIFKLYSIENHELPWTLNFDRIIFTETIEHLFNPLLALKNIYRLLSEDGKLFISTPDSSEWGKLNKYYSNFCEIIEKPRNNDDCVDDHIYLYDTKEIAELLDISNFVIEKMCYSPGTIHRHINIVAKKGKQKS